MSPPCLSAADFGQRIQLKSSHPPFAVDDTSAETSVTEHEFLYGGQSAPGECHFRGEEFHSPCASGNRPSASFHARQGRYCRNDLTIRSAPASAIDWRLWTF